MLLASDGKYINLYIWRSTYRTKIILYSICKRKKVFLICLNVKAVKNKRLKIAKNPKNVIAPIFKVSKEFQNWLIIKPSKYAKMKQSIMVFSCGYAAM